MRAKIGQTKALLQPLSDRERRACAIWSGILVALGILDYHYRGASTLSEAGRTVRRRVGIIAWTLLWGSFAVWFWDHVRRN